MLIRYRPMPEFWISDAAAGFLLYEFTKLLPKCTVTGFDISGFGLATAKEEVRSNLLHHDAREPFPFADGSFDLAISLNALHNLPPEDAAPRAGRDGTSRQGQIPGG